MTRTEAWAELRRLCRGASTFLEVSFARGRKGGRERVTARLEVSNPKSIAGETYTGIATTEDLALRRMLADLRVNLGYSEMPTFGNALIPRVPSLFARRKRLG